MKRLLKVPMVLATVRLDRGLLVGVILGLTQTWTSGAVPAQTASRERISLNADWRFRRFDVTGDATGLIYDVRPALKGDRSAGGATDATRRETGDSAPQQRVLKRWILPTGNDFIKKSARRHARPEGNPGGNIPYVQTDFDDSSWEHVDLPHDWAIKGPFHVGWSDGSVGGGMGRLPSPGIGWYRKRFFIPTADAGKSIFLDVDGAMSYAVVWLNGTLVGGWPFFLSVRVDF